MSDAAIEAVAIAILAKAPVPGFAKTRLAAALGADGAAALQARLTARAVETAVAARLGPVTLWTAPDKTHPTFRALATAAGVALARQPKGDLGARMLAAMQAAEGPVLVIGTDCPALSAQHLRVAADVLRSGVDVVVVPVEDGGYALIGARQPQRGLFAAMPWSTPQVMDETRRRLSRLRLTWCEPSRLWDIDEPADLERLREIGLQGWIAPASTASA
jgi:rSAM/selenodomain-associated transferase 1